MSTPFVHLHNHSDYSILDGALQIKKMVAAAVEYGMPALALTDHGNMFGIIQFYLEAKKAGIKPILGMEAYSVRGDRHERARADGTRQEINHLVLLCRNLEGYRNLSRLSSLAYKEGFYYKPRIDRELLRKYSDGLIACSGCISGEVNRQLANGNYDEAKASALELQEIFGEGNFYLEVQDHGIPEEKAIREGAKRMSAETGIPLVATNDCHYLRKGDHKAHEVLLCINTGKDLESNSFRIETEDLYFRSGEEMIELFADMPEAVENTLKIADKCDVELELGKNIMPNFPLPEGFSTPESYLAALTEEGLAERFGVITAEHRERIKYELDIINNMGFPGYFLITRDFIKAARDRDIAVGPGRGSAAGSLVCYCLGITDIDPIEHGLLFERFLNPERVTMPDIDIDFDYVRRIEVIKYVTEKYGQDKVCQIITFGTMKARAVVRDVGRVLKIPYGEVDRIAKMVPEDLKMTIAKALEVNSELRELTKSNEPHRYKDLIEYCLVLEGQVRHTSTHAAGVIITPKPLIEHAPIYVNNKGEVTTQFEMGMVETVGLLKMDFLGLRTLTVIEDALRFINAGKSKEDSLRPEDIPLDDPQTYELLRRADTIGTFQLESAGMRNVLQRLQPTVFGDIVATNALFRPGPIGSGMVDDFIDRKRGRKPIEYPHPDLEEVLKETYGTIVYQEQVMRIASILAGFSLGQADMLRRAMGKKKVEVMEEQKVLFVDGAGKRGYDLKQAAEIFDLLAFFAGYGFNKSHSAAYALVSIQTAYLKTHYPAEYMAACMTSEMSSTDRIVVFMNECRQMDIKVVPPDVQRSFSEFRVIDGEIIFGMGAVKNVGLGAIEEIIRGREKAGSFRDIYDFCESIDMSKVNRKVLECLIDAGAMDSLGPNRPSLHAAVPEAVAASQSRQREREAGQFNLLDCLEEADQEQVRKSVTELRDLDEREKLMREKAVLGFFVSGHPLDSMRETVLAMPVRNAESIKELQDGKEVRTLGIITGVKRKIDSKERTMAFLTVEDYLGSYEVIAFSSVYGECGHLLVEDAILGFEGRSNIKDAGDVKILLDKAFTVDDALTQWPRNVHIHLREGCGARELDSIQEVLREHPGGREVLFHTVNGEGRPITVRARNTRVETGMWLTEFQREYAEQLHCRFEARPHAEVKPRWNKNNNWSQKAKG
ncbi:MAG: DNA polymerase III subunit alpha [bacterium]|nr:DNA polymerase III subunit alpha [bacterium]